MCGIAGWANLDPNQPPLFGDEVLLRSMCDAMWHRGPDSDGMWLGTGVALGMRRLSIIDLSTGDQPVWNEDKTVMAVMNGEIYNFRELRKELQAHGHSFHGGSDTEVLPHLYEEYGEAMVDKLNGMFCFALWDFRNDKLVIARDRFGEKPLYYGEFEDKLIFASEIKVLLTHPAVETDLDLESMRQYLAYDYVPAPNSIFRNISKLPAAHILTLHDGSNKNQAVLAAKFSQEPKSALDKRSETAVKRFAR